MNYNHALAENTKQRYNDNRGCIRKMGFMGGINLFSKRTAFTLAEVMMALFIIGIMVTLIVPVFRASVQEKVSEGQIKVFDTKFNQAMQYMQIKGELAKQYDSTDAFLNSLKKYANITKVCSKDKLTDCFAEKIYKSAHKLKYETKKISSANDIGVLFEADLGGVVFNDGTNAIIAYKPGCLLSDMVNPKANLTKCIVMLYDVNGTEGPNIIGQDILDRNISN